MYKLYFLFLLVGCATVSYEDRVSSWNSHEDVAKWMRGNFIYEKGRSSVTAEEVYKYRYGDCLAATNFVVHTLCLINPKYNPRWVFIVNAFGDNHWAAAFDYKGKLYIMDYSQGRGSSPMRGTHGPYNSLSEYQEFLEKLYIRSFKVSGVMFWGMSPCWQ